MSNTSSRQTAFTPSPTVVAMTTPLSIFGVLLDTLEAALKCHVTLLDPELHVSAHRDLQAQALLARAKAKRVAQHMLRINDTRTDVQQIKVMTEQVLSLLDWKATKMDAMIAVFSAAARCVAAGIEGSPIHDQLLRGLGLIDRELERQADFLGLTDDLRATQ